MNQRNRLHIFLTILVSFKTAGATYVTRCEGKRPTGQTAAIITCDFPKDLSATQTSFCIYRYESNHTELVLFCHWLRGKPACYSEGQRASLPESVSYQFTTSLRGNITGEFSCETLPPDESQVEYCSVTKVTEESHQGQVQVTTPPVSDTQTTKPTSSGESGEARGLLIVLGVLLLLSVTANLILCGVIKQKHRCNQGKVDKDASPRGSTLHTQIDKLVEGENSHA